ncbi:hypothetical protein AZL_009110 [Azospirillum sp. B510]|uniref:hypothetical protein n=1 Tax=Azospirillum sp. (strain B510) TaxID=137722 RepID=UPI0001C4C46A|nr:hypothetical protein [Azospirillum sp. B510]BAI71549.1 hypothetical protein AZL_009110 [Azospirillum sp. B510]
MKFSALVLSLGVLSFGTLTLGAPAMADDNAKWIAQCLKDNSDAKVSEAVVRAYCTCMNNKMDDNETRTITQWEKANPEARKACEKVAGWQ